MKNSVVLLAGGLAVATLFGSSAAMAGEKPQQCTVTFHLDQETSVRALQFHADYSKAKGEFAGAGEYVDCTDLLDSTAIANNDDDKSRVLRSGSIRTEPAYGPVDVLSCRFETYSPPSPSDFTVGVDDLDPNATNADETGVCGSPNRGTTPPFARDALVALRSALDLPTGCRLCECDVDNSGSIGTSDALQILRASVLLDTPAFACPVCEDSSTTTVLEPTTTTCPEPTTTTSLPEATTTTIYSSTTTTIDDSPTTTIFNILPSTVLSEEPFYTISVTIDCPVCGNGIVDSGEACDDGNTNDADGCLSDCTANPCLSCDGEVCVPNDKASCDDGQFCNGTDWCSDGACSQHEGDPCTEAGSCGGGCDEKAQACVAALPEGTACADDGNPCTDDVCDGKGACGVNNTAPCDDGQFCNGVDVCDAGACGHSGDPCLENDCNTCQEETDNCFRPAGTLCTTDDDRCTDDLCDGVGTCAHPPIPLAPVCNWTVIGGSDTVQGHVRTRVDAEIEGSICADTGDVGETAKLNGPGSWALLADTGTALTVRPAAIVTDGDVVTGGGCLVGKQGALLFGTDSSGPICCADGDVVLPGGNPANVINACGLDPLIGECFDAKAQVPADIALLDSLGSTQSLGNVTTDPAGSVTILAGPGLNVIDAGRIKLNRNSTLTLDAQGNADAVIILRLASGIRASRKVTITLTNGAVPENVLFYAQDGNCALSQGVEGAGTLYCPGGAARLRLDSRWTGAIAGGESVDVGWNTELFHVPFLGLAK